MTVTADRFRDALRKFASGVTVVTTSDGREPHGMTASSFSSVSLDPPRILVCLKKDSQTRRLVIERGSFAVSILAADQADIARTFARQGAKAFDAGGVRPGIDGAPLLEDAIAWIECRIAKVFDGGDHDVVMGDVVACSAAEGPPLIYFDRDYAELNR